MATAIKYKDTTISLEAGQSVLLHTSGKKLTEDMVITAPKESEATASVEIKWQNSWNKPYLISISVGTRDTEKYNAANEKRMFSLYEEPNEEVVVVAPLKYLWISAVAPFVTYDTITVTGGVEKTAYETVFKITGDGTITFDGTNYND